MQRLILFALFIVFSSAVFSQEYFIVNEVKLSGNNKTKDNIILRELLFEKGDTILFNDWDAIQSNSIDNIINTGLFHNANIELNVKAGIANLQIIVLERWYLWPIPQLTIDERNFNTWWQTKDLSRASAGMFLTHNNMRGRGEIMKLLLMLGYNQKIGLSYEVPYMNESKTFGMGIQSIYTLKHEVNAITEFDKQVFIKTQDKYIQRDWISSIQFTYRPKYYLHNLFQIRFHKWEFADTLVDFNPVYSNNAQTDLQYFALFNKLKLDKRNYKPYPLSGYYADIEAFKYGLGILGNDVNFFYLKSTSRKYFELGGRFYAAVGMIAKYSWGNNQPYVLERGLGYGRDIVRGYEYYVIDGQDYILGKSNIKFAVIPKKVVKFDWISSEKFNTVPISVYLNLFADAAYVNNKQIYSNTNKLPNRFLYGGGLGLDFVTYYDAVFRIEWAVNAMNESKIYLHFIAPI